MPNPIPRITLRSPSVPLDQSPALQGNSTIPKVIENTPLRKQLRILRKKKPLRKNRYLKSHPPPKVSPLRRQKIQPVPQMRRDNEAPPPFPLGKQRLRRTQSWSPNPLLMTIEPSPSRNPPEQASARPIFSNCPRRYVCRGTRKRRSGSRPVGIG